MTHRRSSPCIGVCSTTYGDLVCRGCNRFAHEVVEWNAYNEAQREMIRRRLDELRDGAVQCFLSVAQMMALRDMETVIKIADRSALSNAGLAHEVLRRLAVRRLPLPWQADGAPSAASALLTRIDREFRNRSLAAYERSFRILAE